MFIGSYLPRFIWVPVRNPSTIARDVDTEINSDGWPSYHELVNMGYKEHYSVLHGANEFTRGKKSCELNGAFLEFLQETND